MHPRGQELLVMISGTMDVVFEIDGREESHTLPAGQALIVPQGIWHRQRVRTAGSFLAATYGKGTQHRLL